MMIQQSNKTFKLVRCKVSDCTEEECILRGCFGIHIACTCPEAKKIPANLYGKVRTMRFNTLFYSSSYKKPRVENTQEVSTDKSVDKSVDKTDPGDPQFDPTDQTLDHHHEQNRHNLPRLGNNSNIQAFIKLLFAKGQTSNLENS